MREGRQLENDAFIFPGLTITKVQEQSAVQVVQHVPIEQLVNCY